MIIKFLFIAIFTVCSTFAVSSLILYIYDLLIKHHIKRVQDARNNKRKEKRS